LAPVPIATHSDVENRATHLIGSRIEYSFGKKNETSTRAERRKPVCKALGENIKHATRQEQLRHSGAFPTWQHYPIDTIEVLG
jgi:hypothetical protein